MLNLARLDSHVVGKDTLILVKGHGNVFFVDVVDSVQLSASGGIGIVVHSLWAFDAKRLEN